MYPRENRERERMPPSEKKYLLIDIETDDLNATKIWVVVTKDFQSGEIRTWFSPVGLREFLRDFILVGHNALWFDVPVLNSLWNLEIDPTRVFDTLVFSRLLNSWDYSQHSLASWGERLGLPKIDFKDFSQLTDEMVEYCIRDVEVTEKVFEFFQKFINDEKHFKKAIEIEHRAAIICREMHYNGFGFDIEKCKELYATIKGELDRISGEIAEAFPPRQVLNRTILPKPTKSGSISRTDFRWIKDGRTPEELGARVGIPFHVYDTVEFNPSSTKQCIERLWEFGWKPIEKTKGHIKAERNRDYEKLEHYKVYGWTLSEENLETLPEEAPSAAKLLTRHMLLTRRLTTLDEWIGCYNEETKCIHGEVKSIGTWTHRASHTNPNTGNIARATSEFGVEMRQLWMAGRGYRQVGCDAEGIQLRILAHYMEDDTFTTALVSGNSDDGTDVHTLNWKRLNGGEGAYPCKNRTTAKTFIYSYLLGAAAPKTAQIFGCSVDEAKEAREKFVNSFPGLKNIREVLIPEDAKRGYFVGLDGRPVMCDSEHLMLAGYLQNGESIVMKYANWLWREKLRKEKIWFQQMNYVHDEWQTRVVDDEEVAKYVGEVQAQSIVQAGIDLGVKCPLAGKAAIGYNWYDCH